MMLNGRKRSSPFTARQWEELEHQALIFKYMTYGIPIPPDLLYPVRRGWDSFPTNPTIPRLFPQHPYGWDYFPLGFGRKAEDPEPGRCRRTDGKKWRCSKEAFPDSKYCERHMHRGRNRSRKPVELTSSAPISSTPSSTTFSSSSSSSQNLHHPFLYPHSSSSIPPPFSNQNTTAQFNPETTSSYTSTEKDYRHLHPFFSEATGSLRSITPNSNLDNSLQFTPLRSSCLDELKQRNYSVFPSNFSQQQQQPKQQHCFILGADSKLDARKVKVEQEDEPKQPLRWFFDEWPAQQKNRDSWLDLKAERSDHAMNSSTQLSISIPAPDSLFSASNSRSLNDH